MKVFLDCEFNGFGGELISMALVCESGEEWYQCIHTKETLLPWVSENVVPVLGKEPIDRLAFRESLHKFLKFKCGFRPMVVADWYTDFVHFFDEMQGPDYGSSLSLECEAVLAPSIKYTSNVPHNALEDARAIARTVMAVGIFP